MVQKEKNKNIPTFFAHYFSNLNLEGIANLMEDDIKYDGSNLSKMDYLERMESVFDFLKSENVNQLEVVNISCSGCNAGLTGFGFFSPYLRIYYSFILEIKDNKLTDLIECSRFEVTSNGNDNIKRYLRLLVKPEDLEENHHDLPF